MRKATMLAFLSALAFAAQAHANESQFKLKDGPGKDKTAANCVACHSLDYIQMNSPFPDRKLWEAEVNKMIKVMGAPISQDDAKEIIEYLTRNYGKP
jgi:sulfite dehydrogenase (cytochrome) subunit B